MFTKHRVAIPFLLILFFTSALYAALLNTLSLDFARELTENGKTEQIASTLYYDIKAARVVIEVTKPIKQIMVVKDKVLEMYYPVEKQAFRFISEGRAPPPFIESIIQST